MSFAGGLRSGAGVVADLAVGMFTGGAGGGGGTALVLLRRRNAKQILRLVR